MKKKEFHKINYGEDNSLEDNNNDINNSFDDIKFNNNFEDNNNEKENNICKICLDKIENPVQIEKCKHKFCHDCLENYLNNLINENNIDNIPCPDKNCNKKS